ncbi:flagellar basal body rod protein [Sulfitobacter sp. M57]|uniref:flagellar basal body protein n=1 Tax=unclassified Sulfitobacter TaxID=196795 RepID=UPI0023E2384B|nr:MULTISPECIES: flagellar basal body protein [unclassified Sulfitobacter]MDF3414820.1 flagellar basal body rod protein [Sulfitobacter sp. KE5]MDF3422301.1 flagellar basal body rod protein [Sulfitobacter sp. KE43]MDF3433366.1 flagellar basal body rod protein [Sulfitobacter sp. KE42]MDF3459006.1 flagellar basal body rod protein [Sulfitobacter sp. S74]MDF3462905.1 flagellar basal body rod protein [Sulfitobacter sp. Ks18]
MNTETTSIFELAPQRLQWLANRQKVVSENIANADISGARAKDVESFESYLNGIRAGAPLPEAVVSETEVNWGEDMSGNNIALEEQIIEANSTASQFKIAANLYRKAHEMLYTVAGRR